MTTRKAVLFLGLAALMALAGCSDDPVGSGSGSLAGGEMADFAMQSDVMTEQVLNAELAAMASTSPSVSPDAPAGTITKDVSFTRERSCPGGGKMTVSGMIHRTYDTATGVMEAEASGSRTAEDCVHAVRADMTVTVNGFTEWDAFRRRVNGVPDGPQTSHAVGSWQVVRSDGRERSCDFEITVVRDPETHTRTMEGVICGDVVTRTVTWSFDE